MESERKVLSKVKRFALKEAVHPAWGLEHCIRACNLSMCIAAVENLELDSSVLRVSSYLHDMGAYDKYRVQGVDHAVRSVELARKMLSGSGFPARKINDVLSTISGHMFYSQPDSSIPEAVVFHDADTLDLLGSVGIERIRSIIGKDDWARTEAEADNLLRRFMTELPVCVHTKTGKKFAELKVAEMKKYFANRKKYSEK